jgi:4-amino-4-deoxy-L-arabinose transferase-like glycosyltransferase
MVYMSATQHVIDLVFFLLVLAGPIPLCLSVTALVENRKGKPNLESTFGGEGSLACCFLLLSSWCVIQTCLAIVLGIAHCLASGAVLLTESVLFVVGLLALIRAGDKAELIAYLRKRTSSEPFTNYEKMILGTIGVVMAFLLVYAASKPVTDYDSLHYHLPTIANWYQSSSLTMPEEFRFAENSRYPFSWEALCTLFLMPFREDFLVAFPNLIAWAIFGISIYLLGAQLGASRIHSLAASSLAMSMPIVIYNVNSMHIDLELGSFFLAGLYLAVLYSRTHRLIYPAILLPILGMIFGIKTSGIFYAIILLIFVFFSAIKANVLHRGSEHLRHRLDRSIVVLSAASLFSFFVIGCFWYLRNLVEIGNPFGIVRVNIGGVTLLPGPIDPAYIPKTTLAGLFGLTNLSHWKILIDQIFLNLGLPFLTILILFVSSLLLLPFVSTRDHNEPRIKTKSVIGLLILLAITVLLYWSTPYSGDNDTHGWQITPWIGQGLRYAFPAIGVLGILAALGATLARIKDQIIVFIVIACGVLAVLSTPNQRLASVFLYTVVGLLLVWSVLNVTGWARWTASVRGVPRLGVVFILIGVIFVASFAARGIRDRYRSREYHGILDYIENNISKEQTIGYLLDHRPYLLYGKHLDRKVVYIAPDEAGARQGQPDSVGRSQWLDTLEERKVSFVAVGPILDAWKSRKELSWIRDDQKAFVHVFGRDTSNETFIYCFKGHEGGGVPIF